MTLYKYVHRVYRNNPKYWDRYAFANSEDPDQMPQNAVRRKHNYRKDKWFLIRFGQSEQNSFI